MSDTKTDSDRLAYEHVTELLRAALADAETYRQRAEYAESRLASISGVTRQALVERAVRETVEACVTQIDADFMEDEDVAPQIILRRIDPAPIVARVLGGGT